MLIGVYMDVLWLQRYQRPDSATIQRGAVAGKAAIDALINGLETYEAHPVN